MGSGYAYRSIVYDIDYNISLSRIMFYIFVIVLPFSHFHNEMTHTWQPVARYINLYGEVLQRRSKISKMKQWISSVAFIMGLCFLLYNAIKSVDGHPAPAMWFMVSVSIYWSTDFKDLCRSSHCEHFRFDITVCYVWRSCSRLGLVSCDVGHDV